MRSAMLIWSPLRGLSLVVRLFAVLLTLSLLYSGSVFGKGKYAMFDSWSYEGKTYKAQNTDILDVQAEALESADPAILKDLDRFDQPSAKVMKAMTETSVNFLRLTNSRFT